MIKSQATVFVVEDEEPVRRSLERLMRAAGWKAETFATAYEFLERSPRSETGCVLLDVEMPEIGGPELHDRMLEREFTLPVVFLTGHGDVPTSVQAMKKGAVDFLLKPVDDQVLLDTIQRAVEQHAAEQARQRERQDIAERLERLSAREREVMGYVIQGRLNKQIAGDLGIAEKTVKVHRGRIMEKMGVRSAVVLAHLCDAIGGEGLYRSPPVRHPQSDQRPI
ncbi:response regulator transcription factor [Aromatoleum sp.]|uniref:response regulator transcription factor n=1 Tax=Aromatoleum sp. TaxID=2307007 RepID=UPI002FC9FD87